MNLKKQIIKDIVLLIQGNVFFYYIEITFHILQHLNYNWKFTHSPAPLPSDKSNYFPSLFEENNRRISFVFSKHFSQR